MKLTKNVQIHGNRNEICQENKASLDINLDHEDDEADQADNNSNDEAARKTLHMEVDHAVVGVVANVVVADTANPASDTG